MKTKAFNISRGSLAALVAGFLIWSGDAAATTINWGTYLGPTTLLYDSTGAALDDDYFFELGSFGTFIPTEANMTEWLTNWKPFDRAYAPAAGGWISSSGTVAAGAVLEPDFTTDNTALSQTNTFAVGEQAYIWVYQDTVGNPSPTPTYGPGMEWALVTNNATDGNVTDDWLFVAPSGHSGTTLDWRIEDATAKPFGGVNNGQGPGSYTNLPADFVLQTATLAAIPEPGSALLLSLGTLACLRRRRSSK